MKITVARFEDNINFLKTTTVPSLLVKKLFFQLENSLFDPVTDTDRFIVAWIIYICMLDNVMRDTSLVIGQTGLIFSHYEVGSIPICESRKSHLLHSLPCRFFI